MATVKSLANNTLTLQASYKPKMGDSIAINGTCLSVTALSGDGFSVELSPETQSYIALDQLKGKVHMEPAMMMGDRFEGHIVQGHIDTIGTITQIKNNGNSFDVFVEIDSKFTAYVVPKGSITIDGVSLTVNEVFESSFRLTIIPITMKETLFGTYKRGSRVNIETDMFARYIEHIIAHKKGALDWKTVDQISALY